MNLSEIFAVLHQNSYKVFSLNYELNIVGIRSNNTRSNSFDDTINVVYKNRENEWIFKTYKATTDPGLYWLKNPLNVEGTAILKEGQYIGSHQIGLHRGKYPALIQKRPLIVIRDPNRNGSLDFSGKEDTGMFGINIHHASSTGVTTSVDKFSAGCQVFASIDNFHEFMLLADRHKELYSNDFTYSLIRESSTELARRAVA
jgi:hypothetical protein